MAEGWARELKSDCIEPYSAEAGVDISVHRSKHVEQLADIEFDYVVTVCDNAAESCPFFSGNAQIIHRPFEDPPRLARDCVSEAEVLIHYRRVRDEIRDFVAQLPENLYSDGV